MSLELNKGGYSKIMEMVQKIENLANEGVFPSRTSDSFGLTDHKLFLEISSETKKLRGIIQENLFISPNNAGPDNTRAA